MALSNNQILIPQEGWIDVSDTVKVSTSHFEECNMALVHSEGEGLLVDTGYEPPETQRMLDYIHQNSIQLKGIIITHHHEDHDGNLKDFEPLTKTLWDPKNTVEGQKLTVGKKTLSILHTPGHFPEGDLSVLVEDESVLISGDVLYACLPPQLCYGAKPVVLRETIDRIAKAQYRWIIPGHGKILSGQMMTDMALGYIDELYRCLNKVISSGGQLEEALKISLDSCISHRDWMVDEPALDLHRQNIEELFESLSMMRDSNC